VNAKGTIKKLLFFSMWVAIISGMCILFIAAMGKQKRDTCKDYVIEIKGERSANFFLDKAGITRLLKASAHGAIQGQSKVDFNLQKMEDLLEDNVWIKEAQLYFDNQAVLHVIVEEREPVARVFTEKGRSFYVDKEEHTMPLSEKIFIKAPVFTGFPDKKLSSKADSILLHDISEVAQYINGNQFWSAQIAQVDIVADCGAGCWQFEMVPVVGNHVIKFGNGENVADKFNRLFTFYQQVLGRTSINKYRTIDVRFDGQVIGGKSLTPKVDSVQLRKNVERLLEEANELNKIDITEQMPVITPDSVTDRTQARPRAVMPPGNNN
jgi:cell division protein FtsQ